MPSILLAEDEPMLRELLSLELQGKGYEIVLAKNGEEAIAIIDREQPHLLLLDLLMPRIDGYGVLEYVRRKKHNFPVVILSNLSDLEEQKRCTQLGATAFIVKNSVETEELWERVKQYLAGIPAGSASET